MARRTKKRSRGMEERARTAKEGIMPQPSSIGSEGNERKDASSIWAKLDSGTGHHFTGLNSILKNIRPVATTEEPLSNVTQQNLSMDYMGDIDTKMIRMTDVIFSQAMDSNEHYASVGKLTDLGYTVKICGGKFVINSSSSYNHIVGYGTLDEERNAYFIDFFNESAILTKEYPTRSLEKGGDCLDCKGDWVLDSGCPLHMTGDYNCLSDRVNVTDTRKISAAGSEGRRIKMTARGSIVRDGFTVRNVSYSHMVKNILSVPQLDKEGYTLLFNYSRCYIWDRSHQLVGRAAKDDNLVYYMEFFSPND